MKPTVGRIVHYYTSDIAAQAPGVGAGPYPAIVMRAFESGDAQLKVFCSGDVYDVLAVRHLDDPPPGGHAGRYWDWPQIG